MSSETFDASRRGDLQEIRLEEPLGVAARWLLGVRRMREKNYTMASHTIYVSPKGLSGVPASVHFGDEITFSPHPTDPPNPTTTVAVDVDTVATDVTASSLCGATTCSIGSTYTVSVGARISDGSSGDNVFTLSVGDVRTTINVTPQRVNLEFDSCGVSPGWLDVRCGDIVCFVRREASGPTSAAVVRESGIAGHLLFGGDSVIIPSEHVVQISNDDGSTMVFKVVPNVSLRCDDGLPKEAKINVTK
ncbi:hypothetical protein [Polyangium sp. 6x1]|uniref:hypothetical protein n=1 Tax=Polyangium sp. 6x1 TaxID=3042689 RepID=UPI002482F3DC|nr:hypothetical protein [Polyangium sp. 6x1]MDI1448502.1 hypothetical protein [Polyangium sp. 6x1]